MPTNSLNSNGDFKMKTAEWRGYTVKALEDIDKDIKTINKEIKNLDNKIDLLHEKITLMRIKIATIGATSGLITALIVTIFAKIIA